MPNQFPISRIVNIYRSSRETTYNVIQCVIGTLIYGALIFYLVEANQNARLFLMVYVFYALFFALFLLVSSLLFRASAMGNMILISKDQFPHLHNLVKEGSEKLGLSPVPEAFLYNSNGIFNAFARKAIGRKYVMLTSSLLDATTDNQVKFVIGHELGHHAAGHLNALGFILRLPSIIIPFLHAAYSRQCEYTCDRIGYFVSEDLDSSRSAIQMLGCGCRKLNQSMNIEAFERQEELVPGISGFISEIFRSHPRLTLRVISLKNTRLFK